jgi:hypothetical protein
MVFMMIVPFGLFENLCGIRDALAVFQDHDTKPASRPFVPVSYLLYERCESPRRRSLQSSTIDCDRPPLTEYRG